MAIDLMGMCVVVAGAGGGIGSSLCKQLIASNAKVALLGRTKETLDRAFIASTPKSGQARVWKCDVSDPDQVSATFREIITTFGSIDVLVNTAGIFYRKSLEECTLSEMRTTYDINIFGIFNCTKEALPSFLKQGKGHIINIASRSGLTGLPTHTGYSDSKAAMVRISEVWRRELSDSKIKVTTVFNYYTATKLVFPETGHDSVASRLPFVPLQKAEVVAKAMIRTIKKPRKGTLDTCLCSFDDELTNFDSRNRRFPCAYLPTWKASTLAT